MIHVTSLDDPRVADYTLVGSPAALARAGLFVAEGRLVVRRLLDIPRFRTRSVLVTGAARAALADVLSTATHPPIYIVEQSMMNQLAGFNMHRGCLALAERPATPLLEDGAAALAGARRLVVLEAVNNPDNVGGIFRSAAAFGVNAIVLGPHCGDPLYRKAIRTSMAATLQVPFFATTSWPGALATLRAQGFRVLALTPHVNAVALNDLPRDLERVALVVGAEGEGLTADALAAADERVRIPMRGRTDSLNVTVAVSVALFHFDR